MLTINNIEVIRGLQSFGYVITEVKTHDKLNLGGDYYIFGFDKDFKNDLRRFS